MTIRLTVAALCAGLAVVLMLAAIACAATALWMFVLPDLGPAGAPLVVAASLSALTLVVAATAWLILRQDRRRSTSNVSPQLLLTEATRMFSEHKGAVLLAALIAGAAAANGGRKT